MADGVDILLLAYGLGLDRSAVDGMADGILIHGQQHIGRRFFFHLQGIIHFLILNRTALAGQARQLIKDADSRVDVVLLTGNTDYAVPCDHRDPKVLFDLADITVMTAENIPLHLRRKIQFFSHLHSMRTGKLLYQNR